MTEAEQARESAVIERRFREWAALEVAGDLEKWMQYVADDAILQPAGEPAVHGKSAIREYAAKFFELPIAVMEPGQQTIVVSESADLAFNAGNLRLVLDNPDGRVEVDLKSTAIWRKLRGEWRISLNSWSANSQ